MDNRKVAKELLKMAKELVSGIDEVELPIKKTLMEIDDVADFIEFMNWKGIQVGTEGEKRVKKVIVNSKDKAKAEKAIKEWNSL